MDPVYDRDSRHLRLSFGSTDQIGMLVETACKAALREYMRRTSQRI